MNTQFKLKATLVLAALFCLPVAQAALSSNADYKASKTRIDADYKAEKAACAAMSGNAKDVCHEEAKAHEKVALAEAEFAHTGSTSDSNKVITAKAESAYAVAKEKCDDKSGNDKDVCVKEAKAIEAKALADVKLSKKINSAVKDDVQTKRDADYKVSIEKCDSMSGDAKSNCVASAKATFGKS
ncbi:MULTISPECIES: hypothetical protein [Roseateles]|uniref:Cell envelope biogenesis protein TolA n=1 Tax=Roseateles albus TaxID=2987525 RepID=A0ABT5KHM4_9BURK|nr:MULTISPECIES: hypothetical protein [Roseateles]MCV2360606.1 hypothetical protein [Paucibacter sp. TC2R-5]MDC8773361.1 hypothetical protein [Roseateles albus]